MWAEAIMPEADTHGNVLFREPVKSGVFAAGFEKCVQMAKLMIEKAADLANDYKVETITLKLSLDAEMGCLFIADASVEAAIEVEIRRR